MHHPVALESIRSPAIRAICERLQRVRKIEGGDAPRGPGISPPLVVDTIKGTAPPGLGEGYLCGPVTGTLAGFGHADLLNGTPLTGGALPPFHLLDESVRSAPGAKEKYDAAVAANKAHWASRSAGSVGRTGPVKRGRLGADGHGVLKPAVAARGGAHAGGAFSAQRLAGGAVSGVAPARSRQDYQELFYRGSGPLPMTMPQGSLPALEQAGPHPERPENGTILYNFGQHGDAFCEPVAPGGMGAVVAETGERRSGFE